MAGAVLATLALTVGTALADPGGEHTHGGVSGKHVGTGHSHDAWVVPPIPYRGMHNPLWGDAQAIVRGERLFRENCVACHGAEGLGNGELAAGLEHPPANLSRHFHPDRLNNDGYLLWRLTEGGQAEPFRSQNSAMPAFRESLDERDRWSVLAYIHARLTSDGGPHTHTWDGAGHTMDKGTGHGSEPAGISNGH